MRGAAAEPRLRDLVVGEEDVIGMEGIAATCRQGGERDQIVADAFEDDAVALELGAEAHALADERRTLLAGEGQRPVRKR